MVLDFARDNLQLDPGEFTGLSKKVREGDLSVVLKVYEQELKVLTILNIIVNFFFIIAFLLIN